jgi:signal recognition particle subunit SEC65
MAVISKKDEKVAKVVESLSSGYTPEDFVEKYKEFYPSDWEKLKKGYIKHERRTKEGKTHPMPEPEQYLINALNVWRKNMDKLQ